MKHILTFTITLFLFSTSFAQLPNLATDICPILIGEKLPSVKVKNGNGESILLLDSLAAKPTVIIFYRGGWCPFCNRHLAEIGLRLKEIEALGYQVIAISPDAPEKREETISKNELEYQIYSDGDGSFSKAMGIAFSAPERYGERLLEYSANQNKGYLPVPSLFVVNREGVIRFSHVNPMYKERLSVDVLMAVLKSR